jgi:hypothetical protein
MNEPGDDLDVLLADEEGAHAFTVRLTLRLTGSGTRMRAETSLDPRFPAFRLRPEAAAEFMARAREAGTTLEEALGRILLHCGLDGAGDDAGPAEEGAGAPESREAVSGTLPSADGLTA